MKKSLLVVLVLVLVLALVGCGKVKDSGEVVVENTLEQTKGADMPVVKSKPDIIGELFEDYILGADVDSGDRLAEYRIDSVELLSNEEKAELIENFSGDYFDTDVLATVTYSVRPEDPNSMAWTAGNGEQVDDWVVNKTACVVLRNGELNVLGTGW